MNKEIWKHIPNYEGLYMASNYGKVKSLPRNGTIKTERLLKLYDDKYGYNYVQLRKNNVPKKHKVHRLIAQTFLNNYSENLQVNHKNGIKTDNKIENLEMVTLKQNIRHSIETGLKPKMERNSKGQFVRKSTA